MSLAVNARLSGVIGRAISRYITPTYVDDHVITIKTDDRFGDFLTITNMRHTNKLEESQEFMGTDLDCVITAMRMAGYTVEYRDGVAGTRKRFTPSMIDGGYLFEDYQ